MRWRGLCAFGLVCSLSLLAPPLSVGQEAGKRPATLVVRLPHPQAKLTIDGVATRQKGRTRTFTTPALAPGKRYTYTLVVTWRPNDYTTTTRTKEVTVEAGKTTTADLRKEDDKNTDKIIVDFEPTPNAVVEAMCELGEVDKDDVVYDLGCGDGRIVITAVKKFGAKRGVGIDINPVRIKDTRANAKKAGVADKVEARTGDVLKIADLSDATVVMLYLNKELNLRLRPILQKTLKPGARIVSNHHDMGDWRPFDSRTVRGEDDQDYTIYLWRIEKK
jgi:uncharacterized protein (TIGR03000 family)